MSSQTGYDYRINALKGVSIFLVVLGHAITTTMRGTYSGALVIYNIIYSFHMFMYFAVSGVLFEKSVEKYKKNKAQFIKRKALLLLSPYVIITIFDYLFMTVLSVVSDRFNISILSSFSTSGITIGSFLEALFFDSGHVDTHLWFIYVLFFVFVINILLCDQTMNPAALVILVVAGGLLYPVIGSIDLPINTILYWCVPFIIGRHVEKNKLLDRLACIKAWQIILCFGIFVIANCMLYISDRLSGALPTVLAYLRVGVTYVIKYISGATGSILVFRFVSAFERIQKSKIVNTLSKYSYDIYLFHQPFLTVGLVTVLLWLQVPWQITVVITVAIVIPVCIIFSKYIVRRFKVLNKFLLGNH